MRTQDAEPSYGKLSNKDEDMGDKEIYKYMTCGWVTYVGRLQDVPSIVRGKSIDI